METSAKTGQCPQAQKPTRNFITFAQAADVLRVNIRTIKRWMKRAEARNALSVVRAGRGWRIPWPEHKSADGTDRAQPDVDAIVSNWADGARNRLHGIGIRLPETWECRLKRAAELESPYRHEVHRLYLAASTKVLSRGRLTNHAKLQIDLLCTAAFEILPKEQKRFGIETLKGKFPKELRRYWPRSVDFDLIKDAHTAAMVEQERHKLDFTRAIYTLRRRKIKPTAANLCPLLHEDWMADVNDTKERLPVGSHDFRKPQPGISVYAFRRRYPLTKNPWRKSLGLAAKASVDVNSDESPNDPT